ncbi:MAG TPA: glutaminyl-peptide cyclotransferase, partial [Pyrinomonadaceae bacterium]|nr:glutaminyl-peptide cyclotransferase [Pyrinomonadaceae bacterium]
VIDSLNELEYIKGEIYANIWHDQRIARIDPNTGLVNGWIDLTGLQEASGATDQEGVLNGIAYDSASERLFVTGKLWPKLFEIRLKQN